MISRNTNEELVGANTVKSMFPKMEWYDCLTVWREASTNFDYSTPTYDVYDSIVRAYQKFGYDSPVTTGF